MVALTVHDFRSPTSSGEREDITDAVQALTVDLVGHQFAAHRPLANAIGGDANLPDPRQHSS